MADPVSPKPPRPPGQPPPLPPRPLVAEPFLNELMPDTVRTRRDEMPPPQLFDNPEELGEPPLTRREANSLRQEIILLREALPTRPESLSPPSKRQQAAKAVSDVARWTAITVGVLGVATQVAAMFRPDLVGPLQTLIKLLGGSP